MFYKVLCRFVINKFIPHLGMGNYATEFLSARNIGHPVVIPRDVLFHKKNVDSLYFCAILFLQSITAKGIKKWLMKKHL